MTNLELLDEANKLMLNGFDHLADELYDQLLASEPNNDKFIFCKALNASKTNPELSITLFKKSAEINPENADIFENITEIANEFGENSLAIEAYNDLFKMYPDNLEIIYHRAIHISIEGNYLQSILDFYRVVEDSTLKDNSVLFLEHQISTEIIICKTELRNETNTKPTPYVPNGDYLRKIKMIEYQYSIPARLFGDELFFIDFGKMMGHTINEVIQMQPDYISWCILNIDNFCVSEEIIELIRLKGINIFECGKVNLLKLQIYEDQIERIQIKGDFPNQF